MAIENVLEAYGSNLIGTHVGGSGSGGHTIENVAGTDLDQQNTLQFLGTLQATNDPTNGKTKVSNAAEVMEWSDWNAMTVAEREAYAAGKEIDIINFPSADGTISANLLTELWTNPDPTQAFAAQDITLSSSDYDLLFTEYWFYKNYKDTPITAFNRKGQGIYVANGCDSSSTNIYVISRTASYVDDTHYTFNNAKFHQNGSSRVDNNDYMIPYKIYGIKKTLNIKLNAIATDVSTSADKCMMSDGETSVEEAIDDVNSHLIKTATTATGTTDVTGNLTTDLDIDSINIIGARYSAPLIGGVIPCISNVSGKWYFHCTKADGTNLASTSNVAVKYWYYE